LGDRTTGLRSSTLHRPQEPVDFLRGPEQVTLAIEIKIRDLAAAERFRQCSAEAGGVEAEMTCKVVDADVGCQARTWITRLWMYGDER